jgi:hypothetical protein
MPGVFVSMYIGTYNRCNLPVWATDLQALKALRKKLNPAFLGREHRTSRHKLMRDFLEIHHNARRLANYVR